MPRHTAGLIVAYGDDRLMADQLAYRGYEAACGVAAMSPSALGRVAWVRAAGGWLGPCVVADVVAQQHMYRAVFTMGEIVEVPDSLRRLLGFEHGVAGELYLGACPPPMSLAGSPPPYAPPLVFSRPGEVRPSFWPFAPQEWPVKCPALLWN